MIRKIVDQYLENLSGYINADDKLVTYKWLSKELGIHVNLAKQILWEYWSERGKDENLIATYVLMGCLENGNVRIEVVRESDLVESKKKFSKIISEHIYSLQKTLPDLELLVDSNDKKCDKAAIRCSESLMRSEHEFDVLRWGKVLAAKQSSNGEISSTKSQTPSNRTEKEDKRSANERPIEEKSVVNEEKTQKNAFNNMFAKAKDKAKKQTKASPLPNKSKNMMNFFGTGTQTKQSNDKSSDKPGVSEVEPIEVPKVSSSRERNDTESSRREEKEKSPTAKAEKSGAKRMDNEKKSSVEKTKENKVSTTRNTEKEIRSALGKNSEAKKEEAENECSPKSSSALKKTTVVKSKAKSKGKKRQNSDPKESPKNQKKRKRILVIDSSEEESSEEESEPTVPEHFQPEESNVVENRKRSLSPPSVRRENGRRKIRKLVDKTFTDDDGFLVTTKEYVYESCSDKEEETAPSVEPVSEPAAKISNKRKQATLHNFFRKT